MPKRMDRRKPAKLIALAGPAARYSRRATTMERTPENRKLNRFSPMFSKNIFHLKRTGKIRSDAIEPSSTRREMTLVALKAVRYPTRLLMITYVIISCRLASA